MGRNLRLSVKLIGGFAVMAIITLMVAVLGWNAVSNSSKANDEAIALEKINEIFLKREIDHLNWAVKMGEFQRNENMTELAVEKDEHKCNFGKCYYGDERKNAEVKMPDIREPLNSIEEPHKNLHESAKTIEKLLAKGKDHRPEAISFFEKETIPQLKRVQLILGQIRPQIERHAKQAEEEAEKQENRAKNISLIGLLSGPPLALILGIFLSLSITKPIKRIIEKLNNGSNQVSLASGQVSTASQQLAEGSSEQAASLEETSSSLEEMSSMTQQNADNANQANALVNETGQVVEKATRSMSELTAAMHDITAASEETAKIVKTIDEISFQTNLLALNAAVEAARAGEAGAGFAIVADEVRSLAIRAADAARNTATLIETTVHKVKGGAELVNQTAEDFAQVSGSTIKVKELVAEINAASNEQAQGVGQISKAVTEMDKVVQQNAANAEESASASEELSAQAVQMQNIVGELVALVEGSNGNGYAGMKLNSENHRGNGRGPALFTQTKTHFIKCQPEKPATPR